MAYKVFTAGEEATASDVNTMLMSQTVSRFANAAARANTSTGIASPVTNQLSMLDDAPGIVWVYRGSSWVPVSLVGRAVRRVMGAVNTLTNPTAATPLPNATDRAALQLSFVKQLTATRLVLWMQASATMTSGLQQVFVWSLGANGGALIWELVQKNTNSAANSFENVTGATEVTGLGAGTYTFEPFLRSGGSVWTLNPGADQICYTVTEVM